MFCTKVRKGFNSRGKQDKKVSEYRKNGSDLIQDQCMDSALSTAAVQTFPPVSQRGAGAWMTLDSIS